MFKTGILFAALLATPAVAQETIPRCGPHDDMLLILQTRFQEVVVFSGKVSAPRTIVMMDLTVSPSGTWTQLVTSSDGQSCIVADGTEAKDGPTAAPNPTKRMSI